MMILIPRSRRKLRGCDMKGRMTKEGQGRGFLLMLRYMLQQYKAQGDSDGAGQSGVT